MNVMETAQTKLSFNHRKHTENQNSRRAVAPTFWLVLRRSKGNRSQKSHIVCKAESSESSLVQRLLFNAASLLSADRASAHCIKCKGSGGFVCRHCKGTGVLKDSKVGQSGKVLSSSSVSFGLGQSGDWMQTNRCLSCHGTGRTHCKQCQGSGRRVALGQ